MKHIKTLLVFLFFFWTFQIHAEDGNIQLTLKLRNANPADAKNLFINHNGILSEINFSNKGEFIIEFLSSTTPWPVIVLMKEKKFVEFGQPIWLQNKDILLELDLAKKTLNIDAPSDFQQQSDSLFTLSVKERKTALFDKRLSYVSIYHIYQLREKYTSEELGSFLEKEPEEFENYYFTTGIRDELFWKTQTKLKQGDQIPNFEMTNFKGEKVPLYPKDKPFTIIMIGASSCYYCKSATAHIANNGLFKSEKTAFVNTYADATWDTFQNDAEKIKSKIPWEQIWDRNGHLMKTLKLDWYPIFVVLDDKGVWIDTVKGFQEKRFKQLDKYIY